MPSFTAITLLLATAALVSALDPNTVPLDTRRAWCRQQITACPLLCLQLPANSATTQSNTCDALSLTYTCVCENGLSPNLSEYSQTMPYFICTETNNQCVAACGNGNNACQSACRQNNLCGAQDPTRVNISTVSSTMSSTTSGAAVGATSGSAGVVFTGLGGSSTPTATPGSSSPASTGAGVAALDLGHRYGLGVVAAGIFAGFALVL